MGKNNKDDLKLRVHSKRKWVYKRFLINPYSKTTVDKKLFQKVI